MFCSSHGLHSVPPMVYIQFLPCFAFGSSKRLHSSSISTVRNIHGAIYNKTKKTTVYSSWLQLTIVIMAANKTKKTTVYTSWLQLTILIMAANKTKKTTVYSSWLQLTIVIMAANKTKKTTVYSSWLQLTIVIMAAIFILCHNLYCLQLPCWCRITI